ncbi:hypothetical protein HMPREF2141_04226 [Bacteroides uniformis]|uniref:Uncharacterized protein n=1 Tax=Bacteroides uniformis (strain ATCC 8492 / DSM 6597 / CCUG 4942 / CIP 103695 / JCM 5828 / KCTC 5204 / NCTC 13054 / VPI 0061) TaxID=411479 RepID=A0ABC9N842_BACUC|nr:hypothetical protein BACUNI_03729 [Bacteroides uniformis ATCC 8492]KXT30041.1 hypothetical protein HMPREF2141_04226 [Bacteroides uniformis]
MLSYGGKEFFYCHCKSRINLWEMEKRKLVSVVSIFRLSLRR